jgi:hypothetical protein
MNIQFPPWSLGSVLALLVLILAIVFLAMGRLSFIDGGLIALLALARLC